MDRAFRAESRRCGHIVAASYGLLLCLLILIPSSCLPAAPLSPDANVLVRKMVATYQTATTIQETSGATVVELGRGAHLQNSTFKYKRPTLFVLEVVDPIIGTLATYVNGTTVTLYSSKRGVFAKRTALPKLEQNLTLMDKISVDLMHATATQMLNPLSFLLAKGMPTEAQSFHYGGVKMVEGRKTYLVTAQANTAWLRKIIPIGQVDRRDIQLYIDANTNLLAKATLAVKFRITIPARGKTPRKTVQSGFGFVETHRGTILNAPIADNSFSFLAPKDATEVFPSMQ
jgi:outer membrane lipoprotein-sorting protein